MSNRWTRTTEMEAHPHRTFLVGDDEEARPWVHPQLRAAFHALEQAGLTWCCLRLPADPGAPDGDTDLPIDRSHVARARQVLKAAGFTQRPGGSSRSGYMFLAYHPQTERWIRLHLWTELAFGRDHMLRPRIESGCLARRHAGDTVVTLSPDDDFWALVSHYMLNRREVGPRHQDRLRELAESASSDGPMARIIANVCPPGWSPGRILECAERGEFAILESAWLGQLSTTERLRAHADRVLHFIPRLRGRVRRRGLSVALLGPDGAGKSTVAAGVQESFFTEVRSVHMALNDEHLPLLLRLRLPRLGAPGRLLVVWVRFGIGFYHRALGRLVLFDRYVYVTPPTQRTPLKRAKHWLMTHSCPKPDLVLVLDAPAELVYARKGERTLPELEAERQHMLGLGRSIGHHQVVDATRPKDDVRVDVIGRIWERYATRWGNG